MLYLEPYSWLGSCIRAIRGSHTSTLTRVLQTEPGRLIFRLCDPVTWIFQPRPSTSSTTNCYITGLRDMTATQPMPSLPVQPLHVYLFNHVLTGLISSRVFLTCTSNRKVNINTHYYSLKTDILFWRLFIHDNQLER